MTAASPCSLAYDQAACADGSQQQAAIAIGTAGAPVSSVGSQFDGWGYVYLWATDFGPSGATLTSLDTFAIPEAMDLTLASGFGDLTVHEVATDKTRRQAVEIVFDHATKRYPGRATPAVDDLTLSIPGRRGVLPRRAVGRRQDDGDEARQPARRAHLRRRPIDGSSVEPRRDRAAARDRLRDPAGRPLPAHDRRREHRHGAEAARLVEREIAERVDELLDLVDLPARDYRERYASQLSGGERQRVGLARALAADPPVMLMDEPFGALDPITRARLQKELLRIQDEVRKTIIFVTHDIDEAILLGDRIAILREGGVLVQYDTPDAILAHPADDFVARFVGADRGLKRLSLKRLSARSSSSPPNGVVAPVAARHDAPRRALADALRGLAAARRRRRRRQPRGVLTLDRLTRAPLVTRTNRSSPSSARRARASPRTGFFCTDWVRDNWGEVLQPALLQHIKLTLIAVGVGFVIAFVAALVAHRFRRVERPFGFFSAVDLHDPEHRALPAARARHRPRRARRSRSRSSATRS